MKRLTSILFLICTVLALCVPITGYARVNNAAIVQTKAACKIVTQPKTTYGANGATVKVTVKASGSGLKYRWYYKNAGAKKFTKSSVTTATYSVKMSNTVNKRSVYCVVTDRNGKSVQSKTVELRMKATITTQPKTVYAQNGATAKVTVKAVGNGLKYQWYIKNAGATKFTKVSGNTASYSVKMSSTANKRSVYCVVTDQYGNSVKTKTVELRMKATISTQPQTAYAKNGATAKVSVKAVGNGLKYQWYVKNASATKFTKASVTTATYSVKMSNTSNKCSVYCVVTDQYGNSVQSKTVELRMKATITTQPKSVSVQNGSTAKVTVKAVGNGLKYQWYIKNANASKYTKTSVTTASYSVKMSNQTINRSVYCVVTDMYGNSVKSNVVKLQHKHTVVIDKAVEATLTQTGLTEGQHCSACGEILVAQQVIPMLPETYHTITYRNLKGAPTPEITEYAESTGLLELPEVEAPGYVFQGWFTASQGGEIVDYIPEGSTKNYILYARWELVTYSIRYFEAPENDNVDTYTVEDEIYLNDPNWSGLGFIGWTEANNKVHTEIRGGKIYYKIPEGTTGNLDLTANWKLMRNIATPGTNNIMLGEYMEESGRYMFIYELGTIENVVIEELNSSTMGLYNHTGAGDFTLTMSTENTMEESIADSITKTISKSVSSSKEWEESKEWAKEKSNEYSANASYGMEFGGDASPVKASIELGFGYTHSSGESWGGSETTGGSIGEETETGEEVGSCFSYLSSMTTTSEASVTISGDSPHGYYDYVQAGNIRVFGVVTYDPKDGNYYLNTYSILDNMHGIVLYYPDVNMLNNPTCETLEYHIPKDNIEKVIENSYFISYDANGGTGKTNTSVHTVGGSEKLTANAFTKKGYVFIGWELRDKDGLSIATFTDSQAIDTDLADKGEMLKLYALWSPNNYTIAYQNRKPGGSSTEVSNMPSSTACVYDQKVTLAAAPTLSGYTFGGWYSDSGCTEENRLGNAGQVIEKANLTSEVNGVVEVYPKWTANKYTVTFNLDGGTCSETFRQVTFDQRYADLSKLPTPTKSNAIFIGWTLNGVAVDDTTYVRTVGNHSLKANWLSLTWSETRGNGKNKRFRMITDSDNYWTDFAEDWNPNINKQLLEDLGYTKVIITIKFWVDELDQGNQRVYFATPGGKEICRWSFESTPSDWHEYTRSTANGTTKYVDISNFGDNMEFKTIWEAYGNGGDSWDLGETTVTLQFTKG